MAELITGSGAKAVARNSRSDASLIGNENDKLSLPRRCLEPVRARLWIGRTDRTGRRRLDTIWRFWKPSY